MSDADNFNGSVESPLAFRPIGFVCAARVIAKDDFWGGSEARIVLTAEVEPSALDGIEAFSHAEILYVFHQVPEEKIVRGARHPRNNREWPQVGILAQRGRNRPNRLGSTIVRILRREVGALVVAELDAIAGTPVLDIKPVMAEFLPRMPVTQPAWSHDIMRDYWRRAE
jgi:tRNA (Thr-GGU) A37 N-methylase